MHALILAGLGLAIGFGMLERPAHSLRNRKKSVCPANALLRPAAAPGAEDFQCEACQAKLTVARPSSAAYYVPFDTGITRCKIQCEDRAGERGQADLSTCRLPDEVPQVQSSQLRP